MKNFFTRLLPDEIELVRRAAELDQRSTSDWCRRVLVAVAREEIAVGERAASRKQSAQPLGRVGRQKEDVDV